MESQSNLVGVSEAARQLNVHKSTISRQVRDGIIPNHGTGAAPLVDVEEARLARAGGLDRSKQRGPDSPLFDGSGAIGAAPTDAAAQSPTATPPAPKGGLDFQTARTAREGYAARLAQIDLEKQLGSLLDKGDVVDAFFSLAAALREMMETRRHVLASKLAAANGVDAVAAILAEENRTLQEAMAESFERRFVAGEADAA